MPSLTGRMSFSFHAHYALIHEWGQSANYLPPLPPRPWLAVKLQLSIWNWIEPPAWVTFGFELAVCPNGTPKSMQQMSLVLR